MTRFRALLLSVAIASVAASSEIAAQTPGDLLEQGIRAYGDLEYDAASAFLLRALGATPGEDITHEEYGQALIYLAATELYRGDSDSSEAVFRELVLFDTRMRPDELVFPPEVTNIFDAVRRGTKAITAVAPTHAELQVGEETLSLALHASSFTGVLVEVIDVASERVRLLYDGPVNDSLEITWDGLDEAGQPPADGGYTLSVTSRRPGGSALRSTTFPLTLRVIVRDTIVHPVPLADSLFLPEQAGPSRGYDTLLGGLLIGGAVVVLPSALSSDADLSAARFAVGGSVSVAGIVGFLRQRPGRIYVDNVAANDALRNEWRARLDSVLAQNTDLKADVRMIIDVGPATIMELRRR